MDERSPTNHDLNRSSRAVEGERRIITILFCDVKGSTAMAEQMDPEEWAEIINEAFFYMLAPIRRYGGTVARMMGDGFLAFFGAPAAHEDDPQRAVLASLDILEDLRPFSAEIQDDYGLEFAVRIGINTGPVVVGEFGTSAGHEYTAIGDAVNLAARMEQTAKPGTIQISEYTQRQVAPLFEFEPLGLVEMKGKENPVATYRVLGRRDKPGRTRGIEGLEAPLIGRDDEMAKLQAALDSLRKGQGRVVFLLGEAGLGKSRLIREARTFLEKKNGRVIRWHESQSVAYEIDKPYGLFQQRLIDDFGIDQHDPPDLIRQKIDQGLQAFDDDHRNLVRLAIETLLAVERTGNTEKVEAEAIRRELFAGIRRVWEDQTLVAYQAEIFDDLHWADPASADLLIYLLELVTQSPLLILCAMRPYSDSDGWRVREAAISECPEHYVELNLGQLSREDSDHLMYELLTVAELPVELVDLVQQKAEGNPFFMEELVRRLIESGAVVRDEESGRWRSGRPIQDIDIPDSLQALIMSRIDQLQADTKQILQLAAVIGRTFYLRVLEWIDTGNQDLAGELDRLEEAQLIERVTDNDEMTYAFRHEMIREATYKTILIRKRRRYHRQVAEALEALFPDRLTDEAQRLAYHFEQAGNRRQAFIYSLLAGDRAAKLYANAEAAAFYKKALSMPGDPGSESEIIDTYTKLGRVLELSGRYDEALGHYRDLEELGENRGSPKMTLAALMAQATIYSTFTDAYNPDQGMALSQRALTLANEIEEPAAQAKIYWNMLLNETFKVDGSLDAALEYGERSLAIARKHDLKEQMAYTLTDLARPYGVAQQFDKGFRCLEEAGNLFRELGNLPMLADNRVTYATGLMLLGKLAEGLEMIKEAIETGVRAGTLWGQAYGYANLSCLYAEFGRYDEAIEASSRAIWLGDQANFSGSNLYANMVLAYIYEYLGDSRRALGVLEAVHENTDGSQTSVVSFELATLEAMSFIEQGDLEAANDAIQLVRPNRQRLNVDFVTFSVYHVVEAILAIGRGAVPSDLEFVRGDIQKLKEFGLNYHLPMLYVAESWLLKAFGLRQEALESLEEAAKITREMGSLHQLRPILVELIVLQGQLGDRESAGRNRAEAKKIVATMLEHIGDDELRQRFLNLPGNREIIGAA